MLITDGSISFMGDAQFDRELYNQGFAIANVIVPPITIAGLGAISTHTFQ
jgi:hypothetical protein